MFITSFQGRACLSAAVGPAIGWFARTPLTTHLGCPKQVRFGNFNMSHRWQRHLHPCSIEICGDRLAWCNICKQRTYSICVYNYICTFAYHLYVLIMTWLLFHYISSSRLKVMGSLLALNAVIIGIQVVPWWEDLLQISGGLELIWSCDRN